jgi:hypothetical protein
LNGPLEVAIYSLTLGYWCCLVESSGLLPSEDLESLNLVPIIKFLFSRCNKLLTCCLSRSTEDYEGPEMLMFLNLLELFIYLIGESDFFTAVVESFDFLSTLTLS